MKSWIAMALISAALGGCASAPPTPPGTTADVGAVSGSATNAVVVPQDASGAPVQTLPPRAPRVGLGIGLGSWGGRGFGGLGIGLGF